MEINVSNIKIFISHPPGDLGGWDLEKTHPFTIRFALVKQSFPLVYKIQLIISKRPTKPTWW
jgi:hypothetical protein